MADTSDDTKRDEATDIGGIPKLNSPRAEASTDIPSVDDVRAQLAESVKEEEAIYRPLTIVKCHTNLLKLSEKEISKAVGAAGETTLNRQEMEATLPDAMVPLSKMAEQVAFHAIEGAISDLQLEEKNRCEDEKAAQIFQAEIEYHEVAIETVHDTTMAHPVQQLGEPEQQFNEEEKKLPKGEKMQEKTQHAIQQEGGDNANESPTRQLQINDNGFQSLPLITLTTSCGKSGVLFAQSAENITNSTNKALAESYPPNISIETLDTGASQASLSKDDTLNSISAREPKNVRQVQSMCVETCEDESERTESSCKEFGLSKSSELSVTPFSQLEKVKMEGSQSEREESELKPACQPDAPDVAGAPNTSAELLNVEENVEGDFLLAEAEAQFFAEFQQEAGGESAAPLACIGQITDEKVEKSNVSSQCPDLIPSTSSSESNTSSKKTKPITADWVSAKPFLPRQPPNPSYNPRIYNNQPVYEGSSQYFNNNNCHHRSEAKQHIVSAENECNQMEFNDNSELLENIGEDNCSDEVLDIIVLPDQQSKQRQREPIPAPPGNISLRGNGLPCFRPSRFLNPSNQRPMMPRPPYPPHGPSFNCPPPGFPRQPGPGYPPHVRSPFNPPHPPRLPNGPHAPPRHPCLRPPLLQPPPHGAHRLPPPPLRPAPPSNAPPPCGPPPQATNIPPPPVPPFNNLVDIPNATKLCNMQDSMIPFREIDGCCYFDPSFVPDKPPPGVEFGYPQRGKRRKAARLSSRFPTQAGKFHHHANFYVRNCAETAMSNPHDSC